MANLQKPVRQMEQRLGELSREVLRIEAHLRRGEERAASARIDGVRQSLAALRGDVDTPMQLTIVGAQLGLMSGKGSWLRGRLPCALVCAVGGWMYGQSLLNGQRREIEQLADHVDYLESHLSAPGQPGEERKDDKSDHASAG